MMGVRILCQLHILAPLAQSLRVGATRHHRNIVIGCTVKETNRPVTDLPIVDVCRVARSVEGQVGCELDVCWPMQALEPLETRIQGHPAPLENPMRPMRAGSMRGCLDSNSSAR